MRRLALLTLALAMAAPALAQEAAIRKNIAERLPNFPKIDEVSKTPIPGLYEVRAGSEVFYTDEQGDHIIDGQLIDTRTRINLTQERVDKLTAIDFAKLPFQDAIVWKQGNGERKIAVFADPNCGYCKRFERELVNVNDITVYTFLYPILSPDSTEKAKAVWCAPDRSKAWMDLMLKDSVPSGGAACETPIDKLMAFGRDKRIGGTPTIFFEDGERVPGAMPIASFEKRLADAKAAKPQ